MKFILKICAIILICAIQVQTTFALKVSEINSTDYVTDYTNTLTSGEILDLSKKLGELEKVKKISVAVVIVNKIESEESKKGNERGDYIEHFAVKLFEKLKIGDEKKDMGMLWLIVKDTREMRMEVGYGLESVLTDSVTKDIQDSFVRPEFKSGNYYAGIKKGNEKLVEVLAPELGLSGTVSSPKGGGRVGAQGNLNGLIVFLFIIFLNLFSWIVSILGRTKSWYLGGVLAFIASGGIGYSLFGLVSGSVLAVTIITILGFILDFFVSKNFKYWQDKSGINDAGSLSGRGFGPAWWAGGNWGPGGDIFRGSGGSGFGGFGGGGMSGGGGSNSSW